MTDESFITAWNRIAGECIRRHRRVVPDHLILVGSYHNNSAHAVPALDKPADDRVIYKFHCYEPLRFTHQGAPWVRQMDPAFRLPFDEAEIPADFIDRVFEPAVRAAKENGAFPSSSPSSAAAPPDVFSVSSFPPISSTG